MGQVPVSTVQNKLLFVGNGQVANALFDVLSRRQSDSLKLSKWHRKMSLRFSDHCQIFDPTHICLAISDDAIFDFVTENFSALVNKTVCHLSGGKATFTMIRDQQKLTVHAAHPLTTFGKAQSSIAFDEIPFVLDQDIVTDEFRIEQLLPGLKNPVEAIEPKNRPYYHALCALAGGITVATWEAVERRFAENLGLNPNILHVFKSQIFANLTLDDAKIDRHSSLLTGPVARGDSKMLSTHFDALQERADATLLQLYSLLIQMHRLDTVKRQAEGPSDEK